MVSKEVFPNSTVKQVIFQIRFPNLFYIKDKIGDFQLKIMKKFPESALIHQKPLVLANLIDSSKAEELSKDLLENPVKNIWKFKSPDKYELNVESNALGITSEFHKTYDNPDAEHRFKDTIEFVLEQFFDVTKIPVIKRIGLRYIDLCPIPDRDNKKFKEYYKTTFPLTRFKLEDASDLVFRAIAKRGDYFIRFIEQLRFDDETEKYTLDFDAYRNNINPDDCLIVTDKLHNLIISEWKKCIKEPVYAYMRKKPEK